MNYMTIKSLDIANGPGCRISLFVSGCRHHCEGCFNPESWDFDAGLQFRISTETRILYLLDNDYIAGLSILGGEPFEPENMSELYHFIYKVREKFPNKTIWIYTGFTFEQLMVKELSLKILELIDVLVDGKFILKKKDLKLQYCGSTNQRIINVKKSLYQGKVIEYDKYNFEK